MQYIPDYKSNNGYKLGCYRFSETGYAWTIEIYDNDGPIPHFHLIGEDGFNCQVSIKEAKYFRYNGEDCDTLTDRQADELNSFMRTKAVYTKDGNKYHGTFITLYDLIKTVWNYANYIEQLSFEGLIPDYSKLNKNGFLFEEV